MQAWDEHFVEQVQVIAALAYADAREEARLQAWQHTTEQCGLQQPEESRTSCIYRSTTPPPMIRLFLTEDSDPHEAIERIERHWPDIRPMILGQVIWKVYKVHPACSASKTINHEDMHYILLSSPEQQQETQSKTVFFEVQRAHMGERLATSTVRKISQMQTRLRLINEAGYVAACSQTHRCRTWFNGRLVDREEIQIQTADFVLLCMAPLGARPLQYLAGRQPIQSRIMALAQSTSVHLSEDLPEQIEQICVIFRPDFGRGQQLTARATSPFTQDIIMGAALNTWPDLQIPHFHVQEVHISVLDDFNFEPSVKFMMAVSYIDFQTAPALRGVLIHLRIEKARDVKAVPLNHESSALSLLSWARLVHRCLRRRSHHCGIWRNGWEVSGQRAIYLEHGDYVRIEAFKKEEQEHNCDFIEVSDLHYAPEFTVEGFWPMSRDRSGQSQGWTSTSEADGARHLPRPRLRMLDICFPTSRLIKNEAGKFSG